MTLNDILSGVKLRRAIPRRAAALQVKSVEYDSRQVGEGCLFFAFRGRHADGRQYAAEAAKRGAVAVASELGEACPLEVPWIEVEHGRQALALASRNLYGPLDERLLLTGITGTNGKTTVAWIADSILRAAGKTTALVGTIQYRVAGEVRAAPNTTPESLDLYRMLAELDARRGSHVTMEVSSHALALARVYGIRFHSAVFTNFSRDHLDFHGTMEEYFAAKQLLFTGSGAPPPRWAAVNMDDPHGRRLRIGSSTTLLRYGLEHQADVSAENISATAGGLRFDLRVPGRTVAVRSALAGRINVHNILAAAAAAVTHGLDADVIAEGVGRCSAVPGRFERVDRGQPFAVVVDYAHTDDALRNVIRAARDLSPRRLITVFGCGGDRDRDKRPLMGAAAAELSDLVILTSDNPRSEDPLAIMNDAMVGLQRHDTPRAAEPDRRAAIRKAIEEAGPGDLVLIAGKGHETCQILKDGPVHFDDREVAAEILQSLGYGRETK